MSNQDSDEEGFCICDPNVKLPRISYFKQRSCFKATEPVESDGWIRIGKVKQLFIYPVEYGTGFQETQVLCTNNGPEFVHSKDNLREIKDRRLVVHNKDIQKAKDPTYLNVHLSPTTNITTCAKETFYAGSTQDLENDETPGLRISKRLYNFAEIDLIRSPSEEIDLKLQQLIQQTNPDLRLGYFTANRRNELINNFRFTMENRNIQGMLPNYSHFTLINTKSVEYLKQRYEIHLKRYSIINENPKEISSKNFFPHIVMEGDACSHFQEDSVRRVKIGQVEFGRILPCVQDETVIFNHVNPKRPFSRLRIYLEKHRQVQKIYNELDNESENAVFGINMEKLPGDLTNDDNKISEGDVVYVKYEDIPNA